jgi:hypothetical protein
MGCGRPFKSGQEAQPGLPNPDAEAPSAAASGELVPMRDKDHLKFVSKQPCVVCGREPSDAHHLGFAQPRALGGHALQKKPYSPPINSNHFTDRTESHGFFMS